jgi:ATP-dependent protease ClpP protease subunit
MGCSIFLACHKRYCYPRSMFLIHDGFVGNEASTSKFKDFLKFLTMQEKQLKNLILSTTKITKAQLDKKFATEWYIDAEEALKLGIVDEILTKIK